MEVSVVVEDNSSEWLSKFSDLITIYKFIRDSLFSLIPTDLEEIGSIWAIEVIETPEDKGTFTSLLNEGMVYHHTDINPKDNLVGLTEKGFEAYRKSIQP